MKKLFLTLFCFSLIYCKKNENLNDKSISSMVALEDVELKSPAPSQAISEKALSDNSSASINNPSKIDSISKKIIKNGEMTIQVGDIKKAQQQVGEILSKSNAYVQKEDFRNTDTDESLNLIIRVPHKNFDILIDSFSNGVGSILSKNISSDDVTEEYTDVTIKLANKKIYLEKYRDMLRSASTTKDMIEIQEKIRELVDEIDIAEGRLRFIDDRVKYSTFNLTLYKEKIRSSTTSKIGFGSRFGDSFTEGWNSFVSFSLGIISFWPYFLLFPIFILIWKKWKRKTKK
ncbi:DUF4349 domain-containing protein [Chryseobacterium oryctis]|uniref:DUF4349 domain-containing protein n=1 Tax=Chryseobacterium oryctis TaxID=2952618 RepID=A0ABT3HSD8_9FLAO|nr:DUF4349 domain-containing protein [Chryseobacterium oryctis]MCW3162595.1 DUF4349 domain-containing protein [Chryseobacterium oryctis]